VADIAADLEDPLRLDLAWWAIWGYNFRLCLLLVALVLNGTTEWQTIDRMLFSNWVRSMGKLKTRKAAAKRFKVTGTGKFMRRQINRSHLLEHKSPGRKRRLEGMLVIDKTDEYRVSMMLPYA
jgi:large subunit ribosomal protein L35